MASHEDKQGTFFAYLLCAGLSLTFGVLAVLTLPLTPWYIHHAYNPGVQMLGYSHWMKQRDCDILLYGDSTAITGLDPLLIQRETGLKACNIAEGTPVLQVVGSDAPLRYYLEHHAPPRFLVGMWTASYFRPDAPPLTKYYSEGFDYGLRYISWPRFSLTLLRHPYNFFHFASDTLNDLSPESNWLTGHPKVDVQAERLAHGGQWVFPGSPQTKCTRPLADQAGMFPVFPASAADFRRKYSTTRTAVIVDIAPTPTCERLADAFAKSAQGQHNNEFEKLPISDFNNSDVHFDSDGAEHVSERVAQQILQAERHAPKA